MLQQRNASITPQPFPFTDAASHAISPSCMNDPVLIFFVALAAFISYRLFSVLGTRGGHEPRKDADPGMRTADTPAVKRDPENDDDTDRVPTQLPAWAETVREHYPGFEPSHFLDGARSAYEMIVQAFARGELEQVRSYVDAEVLKAFEVAVDGRRQADQIMDVTFVGIERSEVEDVSVHPGRLDVTVAFRSDQIRVVRDKDGEIVDGDPNRIDLVRDRWTFSRPVQSADPNWTLTATHAAPAAT